MKKLRLFFSALALLCFVSASAHDFEVDGIYYNITSNTDLIVELTYRGTSFDSYSDEYSGSVSIPGSVTYDRKTYSVTSIGKAAFRDCSELQELSLPASILEIKDEAFNGCCLLKNIRFENGNSAIRLGVHGGRYDTWSATKNLFYDCPLENLYIGRDLDYSSSTYGSYTPFYDRDKLKTIIIGKTVTFLGDNIFYGCDNVKTLKIEDGNIPLSIGKNNTHNGNSSLSIFSNLINMDSLYLGRDINGESAFSDLDALKIVELGEMVTSIHPSMFKRCDGLVEINLHEGISRIGEEAFAYCLKLSSINIPRSVKCIENSAFKNCASIKCFYIPNTVDSIGNAAVPTGLSEVCIEDGATELHLGYYSYSSTSMGRGLFPQSVTKLHIGRDLVYEQGLSYGESPFFGGNYTEVTFGDNVTRLGDHLFASSSLREVVIPKNVKYIGKDCFGSCVSLTSVTFSDNIQIIDSAAFYGTALKSLILPENVDSIGDYAFAGCNITHITLPASLKRIGEFIFYNCDSLKSAEFNCPIVKGSWFGWGSSLKNIVFGDSVKTVMSSFETSHLETLVIGKNVSYIEDRTFWGDIIDTVYVESEVAREFNQAIFKYGLYSTAVLCVPEGSEDSYSSTMPWRLFAKRGVFATKISDVLNDCEIKNAPIYNFQGMKMQNTDNLPKGIYIKGGKKYLVK